MKRFAPSLATVIVLVLGFSATGNAQVPTIGAYFDDSIDGPFVQMSSTCPDAPIGTVHDEIHIVLNNVNAWVFAVEFSVDYTNAIEWRSDIHLKDALSIGKSPDGVAIAFGNIPINGLKQVRVMSAEFVWACNSCDIPYDVSVNPHGETGFLRAVTWTWPDTGLISLVGANSMICPGLSNPVEQQTWGAIKSLYR